MAKKKWTGEEILAIEMEDNDAGARTVREYLVLLARQCWMEGEGFSGKRPFGNSGWHYEVYGALMRAGAITGDFDEEGCINDCDTDAGYKLVMMALSTL